MSGVAQVLLTFGAAAAGGSDFSLVAVETTNSGVVTWSSAGGGSITPNTYNGHTISSVGSKQNPAPGSEQFTFIVMSGVLAQNFFTSMTLNGTTLLSANAAWSQFLGLTTWQWSGLAISAAGTYPFTIV